MTKIRHHGTGKQQGEPEPIIAFRTTKKLKHAAYIKAAVLDITIQELCNRALEAITGEMR